MTSKSTSIPSNTVIGLRQISRQMANIKFSREVDDFLSDIDAEIVMKYSAANGSITHQVVSASTGRRIAQTSEFERLGKYRSMVTKAKEKAEDDSKKDSNAAFYANMMANFRNERGEDPPARMLIPNQSKFGNFKKSLKIIEENVKVIETLTNSVLKTYILNTASILHRVYVKAIIACFGNVKYEQEQHDELLFRVGIPKFMESKLIDKSFAKDAKHDALPLLFPRGNFMTSVSFKTAELKANHFLVANAAVMVNSQSIVALARSNPIRNWFIPDNHRMKDEIREQWEKFTWPMLSPGSTEEFLKPRMDGINVRMWSPLTAPRERSGESNFRSEGAMQKEIRSIKNLQSKMLSTMLDFFHFIPRTSDPLSDFWCRVTNTDDWVITPDKTIYAWVNEAGNKDIVLNAMEQNCNGLIKRQMARIVLTSMDISSGSARYETLRNLLQNSTANNAVVLPGDEPGRVAFIDAMLETTIEALESGANLTDPLKQRIKEFRGKATEDALKKDEKDRLNTKGLLDKPTKKIIGKLTDKDLKKAAEKWLREDFREDNLRRVAARYFVSAVYDLSLGVQIDDDVDDDSSSSSDEGSQK